jgi:hypothetical protein
MSYITERPGPVWGQAGSIIGRISVSDAPDAAPSAGNQLLETYILLYKPKVAKFYSQFI